MSTGSRRYCVFVLKLQHGCRNEGIVCLKPVPCLRMHARKRISLSREYCSREPYEWIYSNDSHDGLNVTQYDIFQPGTLSRESMRKSFSILAKLQFLPLVPSSSSSAWFPSDWTTIGFLLLLLVLLLLHCWCAELLQSGYISSDVIMGVLTIYRHISGIGLGSY